MRVLVEITEANREGASADDIHELFQHARELLDIMEGEIVEHAVTLPSDARAVLVKLRSRLESLEQEVSPKKH